MTLALEFPVCSDSPLGRLDARWKLAALLIATLIAAFLRTLPAALAAAAGALVLVVLARLPARWLLWRLGSVALVLGFFVLWLPFVRPNGEMPWQLGLLALSPSGVQLAALLLLKALTVVALMLTLLASAPIQETFAAAHRLRVPGILVHIVLLTYRFIFSAADEFARLRIALRVRGFRNRADLHSYRTVGQVAGTLLVRSHDRAERVGQAMRCRGFDGIYRTLDSWRTRPIDCVAFGLIVGGAVAIGVWDLLAR
jgi:cobalt/nickel transport system permease protein